MLAILVGCQAPKDESTSVRLTLEAPVAELPKALVLTAYNRYGLHVQGRVPETGELSQAIDGVLGTVVIYAAADGGPLRVHIKSEDGPAIEGALTIELRPQKLVEARLRLDPHKASDADDDAVPDAIDSCPQVSNPDQQVKIEGCAMAPGPQDNPDAKLPDGVPPKLNVGRPCSAGDACASGFCVDGVCCDGACTDRCRTCSQSGSVGRCVPAPSGTDPRDECPAKSPESCGSIGACDGSGACMQHPAGTPCQPPSCGPAKVNITFAGTCDGAGACRPGASANCAPFLCENGACRDTCDSDEDCAAGRFCVDRSCGPKPLGRVCGSGTECASGHCTDGVCCQTACGAGCEACNISGSVGVCAPKPAGADSAGHCPKTDPTSCGPTGTCNGKGACALHPAGTTCGLTCGDGQTHDNRCNGAGQCKIQTATSCFGYACQAGTCRLACTIADDCASTHDCLGNICLGRQPEASSCTLPDQCAARNCTPQGVCCPVACEAMGCALASNVTCDARFGFECVFEGFYINDCCFETLTALGHTGAHVACGARALIMQAAFDYTREEPQYHRGELRRDFAAVDLLGKTFSAWVYLDGPAGPMNANLTIITAGSRYHVVKGSALAPGWNNLSAIITQTDASSTTGLALQFYLTNPGAVWSGNIIVDDVDWR